MNGGVTMWDGRTSLEERGSVAGFMESVFGLGGGGGGSPLDISSLI